MYWRAATSPTGTILPAQAGDSAWGFDSVRALYESIERWHGTGDPARESGHGIISVTQDSSASALGHAASDASRNQRSG